MMSSTISEEGAATSKSSKGACYLIIVDARLWSTRSPAEGPQSARSKR